MSFRRHKPIPEFSKVNWGEHYWEVWEGLPDFPFQETLSRGGHPSLRYEQNGHYIWVATDAYNAYKKNPQSIFPALMERQPNDKIFASLYWPSTKSLDETLDEMHEANRRLRRRGIKG